MTNIVLANLDLVGESQDNKLPCTCNAAEARRLGAYHVSNVQHDIIIDEISCRDRLGLMLEGYQMKTLNQNKHLKQRKSPIRRNKSR
jgi:hypothetical protein